MCGGGSPLVGGGGGGLPSPLPVRGEVRGEEIIVGEIHSVEILITLKLLCVFSSHIELYYRIMRNN